jgi:predicted peroxiredoxin
MKRFAILLSGIAIGIAAGHVPVGRWLDGAAQAQSQATKPSLFVNMTTGDSWRGWMGLHFAHNTMKMGHQVTIFLNLDAVTLASLKGSQEQRPSMQRVPRDIVADFIKDGGKVLICGPCLVEFGLKMEDLVPGVELGKPSYTQSFIFAENARTLTW